MHRYSVCVCVCWHGFVADGQALFIHFALVRDAKATRPLARQQSGEKKNYGALALDGMFSVSFEA